MTTRQKIIDAIIYISTGFTVGNGLLFLVIVANRDLYRTLIYHYSDNIIWYVMMFGLPLILGIAFYLGIKRGRNAKGIKILFGIIFIFQLVFTIISAIKNIDYWGYAFKRPTVFKEIESANKILQCSKVINYDSTGLKPLYVLIDTTSKFENSFGRKDPYYDNVGRAFMVFQYNSYSYGGLYDFLDIYYDTTKNLPVNELESIDKQIQKSGIVVKGEQKFEYDHLGQFEGVITKFKATDNKTYIFAGLNGREVSNDHYPFYEFLFVEKNEKYNLIKKQIYYTDLAGIEGLEFANILPLFSLLLTIAGIVVMTILLTINKIKANTKRHQGNLENITHY
jgi:hypothetical protein